MRRRGQRLLRPEPDASPVWRELGTLRECRPTEAESRLRADRVAAGAVAGSLALVAAEGEAVCENDGITLGGTARIVTLPADVCRMLGEHGSEEEYERMKANHAQPLRVWRLDSS